MKFLAAAALLISAVSALNVDVLNSKNAPNTGQEWISIGKHQEAQMADFSKFSPEKAAKLRASFHRLLGDDSGGYDANFVDGSQRYEDEQQAWRYLGLFVDCNPEVEIGGDCEDGEDCDERGRFLGESNENADTTCTRYVLWAAYVDPNYEGGGIGEYQFWDRHNQEWDSSACEESGTRCGKMDCHLPDTEFELLGFFKIPSTDDFMDQLFKHEGYCTWFQEEYNFMQGYAQVWPRGCTPTYINDLYLDVKPMPGGDWSLGIYTDEICTQEYDGKAMSIIQEYSKANPDDASHDSGNFEYGDLLSLAQNIEEWNDGMSFWKQCHPCRAYNIGNGQDATDYQDDDGGGRRRRAEDGGSDDYTCNDDAGYTDVNQCMKFYSKTDLQVATFRNIALANAQGSIVEIDLENGKTLGSDQTVNAYFSLNSSRYPQVPLKIFFFFTLAVFVFGAAFFVWAWRTKDKQGSTTLKHPLVESEGVVS